MLAVVDPETLGVFALAALIVMLFAVGTLAGGV
jgi:hypothetical protein